MVEPRGKLGLRRWCWWWSCSGGSPYVRKHVSQERFERGCAGTDYREIELKDAKEMYSQFVK